MLLERDGFQLFTQVVQRVGSSIAEELDKGIICDALVLRECFLSAKHSITFHGPGEEANHLKQAGHCCFWLAKLKPLDFTLGAGEFAGALFTGQGKKRWFRRAGTFTFSRSLEAITNPADKKSAVFPINEYFGLLLGHTMAIEALQTLADKCFQDGDSDQGNAILSDIHYHSGRYKKIAHRVVKSLRVNNYTARGTATMFEWAYERPRHNEHDQI